MPLRSGILYNFLCGFWPAHCRAFFSNLIYISNLQLRSLCLSFMLEIKYLELKPCDRFTVAPHRSHIVSN